MSTTFAARAGDARVPFAPLEELVRYRVIADDTNPKVTSTHVGVPRIAARLDVDPRQIHRWRHLGVTADQAVELADRIRVPWANVWPELLDHLLQESSS